MSVRPVVLQPHEVRNIPNGTQTQVRRVVRLPKWMINLGGNLPEAWVDDGGHGNIFAPEGEQYVKVPLTESGMVERLHCPLGTVGDRLWAMEVHYVESAGYLCGTSRRVLYAADGPAPVTWTGASCIPKWASRITLEIVGVRAQYLQHITDDAARAEGIVEAGCMNCGDPSNWCHCAQPSPNYRDSFAHLWDSINAKKLPWVSNPFVWALTVKLVERP